MGELIIIVAPNTPYKPMIPCRICLFEVMRCGIITFMGNVWTPEKIENFRRSSEYTAFHKKLSVLAEPYLDDTWSLVDIGCGTGLLDIWLAPMVASIDAVDTDTGAIECLAGRIDDVFRTEADIAENLAMSKAVEFLVENAKVKEGK